MSAVEQRTRKTVSEPQFDHLIVIVSDIEMGAGGDTDDFPHSEFLSQLLLAYQNEPYCDIPVDLVFNGDTFDLIKTPHLGTYPHHITKEVALSKTAAVAAAHPEFFEALRRIVEHPPRNRTVSFIVGNHDAELLFPEVQGYLRAVCGDNPNIRFPGFELTIGPVQIEHGCQSDPIFRIDPNRPFINEGRTKLLNISWATIALLDVLMPLHPLLHLHARLRPRNLLMELLPEVRELLLAKAWRYWTRDFWVDFISLKDPVLKLNWTMIKEIVKQITMVNPDVSLDKGWLSTVVQKSPCELFVTGHLHRVGSSYFGTKRIIQMGCFRDEYFIKEKGRRFQPILKPVCEVYLKDNHIVEIMVKEVRGPDRPQSFFPHSIYDVLPGVRELLEKMGDHVHEKARQKEQEMAEGKQIPTGEERRDST